MADTLTEEHHDWMSSFLGFDTRKEGASSGGGLLDKVSGAVGSAVKGAENAVSGAVASVEQTASSVVNTVEHAVAPVVTDVKQAAGAVVDGVKQTAAKVEKAVGIGQKDGSSGPKPEAGPHADGSPASQQPAGGANLAGKVLDHFDPQGTLDFPFEVKGPKTAGVVKVNKAYFKASVKISVSDVPQGDVSVGPAGGPKSSDGKVAGQVGVTAEAKKSAQTELTKKFDAVVNSLVKSVTDKDGAVKTELFAKAKAEAKGGTKDASVKVAYDFGLDATVFGVGKATLAGSLTLVGLKYKPSDTIPISATVLSVTFSEKVAVKWKKAFNLGQTHYDIEGSVETGAEFEPNWAEIAKDAAVDVAETGASAAIMTAIDAAALAGPPLLAGIIIAQGIYMAGEKGDRDKAIIEGAIDARSAAFQYAATILGSKGSDTGPRAKAAIEQAMKELAQVASSQHVSVDEVMTELRKMAPHPDFARIHAQARQQIFSAYYGEVTKVIKAWRKEHYLLAAWTLEEDDLIAVNKLVAMQFAK